MSEMGTCCECGEPLPADEVVGRCILDRRSAERAACGKLPARELMDAVGVRCVSCDRLDVPPSAVANARGVALAVQRTADTGRPHEFRGWATLKVSDVRGVGCDAVSTPKPGNPNHCDIVYPPEAMVTRDEQKRYATRLVAKVDWVPRL